MGKTITIDIYIYVAGTFRDHVNNILVYTCNEHLYKQYNLITEQILMKLPEKVLNKNDILYYKKPSFIRNVDYKGIVGELWNTTIDENDKDEDKYVKQLIGNVNYGLLEKGVSTSHKHSL